MGDKGWFDSGIENALQSVGLKKAADWVDSHEQEMYERVGLDGSGLRAVFLACAKPSPGQDCMVEDPEVMRELTEFYNNQPESNLLGGENRAAIAARGFDVSAWKPPGHG